VDILQQATRGLLLAAIAVRVSKDDRAQRTLTLLLKKIAEQVRVIALHIKPDSKSTHLSLSFHVIFFCNFRHCLFICLFIHLSECFLSVDPSTQSQPLPSQSRECFVFVFVFVFLQFKIRIFS
jgi:hypothetical protein